jgi:putative FmdB family regulatory protein
MESLDYMPIYRFRCNTCNRDEKKLMTPKEADAFSGACFVCGKPLSRVLSIPSTQAKETVDEYRGKSVDSDIDNKIAERAHEHWVSHDLPRIIAEQGKEYAVRQGFIDVEGNVVKGPNKPKK